jgi:hypothetical protein
MLVCDLTCGDMVSSRGCVTEMGLFQFSEPFHGPQGYAHGPQFILMDSSFVLHYLFMSAHEVRLEIFEMLAQEVRLAVDDFCSLVTKNHKLLITINLNYSLCR